MHDFKVLQGQFALDFFKRQRKNMALGDDLPNPVNLTEAEKKPGQRPNLAKLSDNKAKPVIQAAWWQPAMMMFLKLSVWIAGPVIIALYLGKWLDKKFATEPWLFLLSMGAAFLISMIGLIKNTLAEYKKIEQASKKKDETKQ